ncbi:MAG: O-antigen ligase family protein [Candidatus Aureabacteria bacterium]|nr:O-antigen ligase family protein [Candidatus Auribacterota bacterium]
MGIRTRIAAVLDRLVRWLFYPTLILICLRPSCLKFATPLGRVSITSAQNLVLALVGVWLLSLICATRWVSRSGLDGPLILFVAAHIVSLAASPFGMFSDRFEALIELLLYAGFFLMSLTLFRAGMPARRIVAVLFWTAVLVAAVDLAYHSRRGLQSIVDQGYPLWDGKNALGLFMALALASGTMLLTGERCALLRSASVTAGLFLIFLCAVYSYSRGSWLGIAGMAVMFACRRSWKWVALILAALLLLLLALPNKRVVQRFAYTGHTFDVNASKRVTVWKESLRMLRDYPLTGVGPGQFRTAARLRIAAPGLASSRQEKAHYRYLEHAHNLFLQAGAEAGFAAIAALVWGLIRLRRIARRAITNDPGTLGLAAACVAYLLFSLVDCSWTGRFAGSSFMHINLIMALIVAMLCHSAHQPSPDPDNHPRR